ncbi:MAG: hypothetical protein M0Z67_11025 [Nitrospiraceae bacterium]|nr:hypothetical protein [Nitrospiraceae bacterium]
MGNSTDRMKKRGSAESSMAGRTEEAISKTIEADVFSLFTRDFNDIRKRTDDMIRLLALEVKRRKEWAIDGFRLDNDSCVMEKHHLAAEEEMDKIMNLPLSDRLKIITEDQAYIYWLKKGAVQNYDKGRMDNDYYDGKRYIGFLLAESIIEACKRNELGEDCLDYLHVDFFEYLRCITLEEYIRIRAFLAWERDGGMENNDHDRMTSDYYSSMDCVQNTMWNCKGRRTEQLMKKKSMHLIRSYFLALNREQLRVIKEAKIYAGNRLNIEISREVNGFVDEFYEALQTALKGETLSRKVVEDLLSSLYANSHVVNMLEYMLRCFLCTFIDGDIHNLIRSKHRKCPINAGGACQPLQKCTV